MRRYRPSLYAVLLIISLSAVTTVYAVKRLEARPGAPAPKHVTFSSAARRISGHQTSTAARSSGVNWGKPIFVDNFTGTSLNLQYWSIYNDPRGVRSGTPRTPQSVQVSGGYLDLIGHYQSPYGYVGGGVSFNHYQTYGRWVVRFRADAGEGYEPVALLWPEGPHADGEIDIAEVFPANRRFDGEFVHMGPNFDWMGRRNFGYNFAQWHTFAVDWLPSRITFWLDGKITWQLTSPGWIPRTPFHLALQMDKGCTRNRCAPDSPEPVVMQVDWVKIYAPPWEK